MNRPRTFFTAIVTSKEGVKETDQDSVAGERVGHRGEICIPEVPQPQGTGPLKD